MNSCFRHRFDAVLQNIHYFISLLCEEICDTVVSLPVELCMAMPAEKATVAMVTVNVTKLLVSGSTQRLAPG